MKKISLIICTLFVTAFAHSQFHDPFHSNVPDFIGETKQIAEMEKRENAWKLSELRIASSNNYDVKYHRCQWNIDPNVYYISGSVTTFFVPTTTGFSQVDFDFNNNMTIDSVIYHGATLSYSRISNVLGITLPSSIPQGELDSVSVYYQGAPVGSGWGSFIQNSHSGTPIIWTLSEPYGGRDWWPCKQSLNDKIDSIDIYVTCPQAYRDGSNGVLVSETLNGIYKTYHWKSHYPIAAYLVALAVTNYSQYSDYAIMSNGDSLEILNYVYPESLASAQSQTPAIIGVLELFGDLIVDYPFKNEKYGHCQFGWGGGMEHQTMTYCSGFEEWLIAHECAHQWFGDRITCGSWEDIWLNEGFATFFEGLTQEFLYPSNFEAWKQSHRNLVVSAPGGSVKCVDTTSVNTIFDSRLSYSKGAYVLRMLRWELGDSIFFEGIKQYLNDPALAYGYAKTPDYIQHMESVSGKNLTTFFNQWYYNQGYPTYNLSWYPYGNSVNITVNQTQSHTSVAFFAMHVPVQFKDATHDITVVLDNTFSGQAFNIDLDFVPTEVILDPKSWMLHKNDVITQTTNPLSLSTSVAGSPFCPNAPVSVSYSSTGSFAPGNIFTAQLSDISGSFSSPVTIGTLTSSSNSGIIPAILASSLPAGTGYKIRVVSNYPAFTATDNGTGLTVNTCAIPTGIIVSGITKKAATLTWSGVACAVKYPYQYRISGGTWIKNKALNPTKKLTELSPNTTYQFKVQTTCSADGVSKSIYSVVTSFKTLSLKEGFDNSQSLVGEVNIFPNPTRGDFVVQVNSLEAVTAQIRLCNMLGEELSVRAVELTAGKNDISYPDNQLLAGLYFVSVQTNNSTIVLKIIIE